jgi:deoxyadenosine/deoxycytidine kinase
MTNPLRIAIEGNIGVGKSTLLPKLKEVLPGNWEVQSERVDEDPEFKKLLEDFYKNPNKQLQLQSWINFRRLSEFKSLEKDPRHFIFERSFLGELVFCHANLMRHEKPHGPYIDFFYKSIDALRQCKYDAIIYLKASPERCFERIKFRSRGAENNIDYDYIRYLHHCYEVHLPEAARTFGVPLVSVDWEGFGSARVLREQLLYILSGNGPDLGLGLDEPENLLKAAQ